MSQLQVTGEAKIRDIQGPVVSNSGVISALNGNASQYVRGDGTLADFPTSTGGGSSVSYYLNSSVSQGTIGGVAYRQLSKTPISGAGTDITASSNGYIASYITDANDPSLLEVPAGNFNCEFYFSVNSNNHNPYVYAELYKYDGTTFTLLGSNQAIPEYLTNGTTLSAYYFAIPVAVAALNITDRLAIRIYVNVDTRTVTLHTENNHLCQVVTTFSKGLTTLNNLTRQVQYLGTGTSGTDFNISSVTATHTFNLPVASATNTGKLSSTDWSTFNNKLSTATAAATYVPYTGATSAVNLGIYDIKTAGTQLKDGQSFTPTLGYTSLSSVSSGVLGILGLTFDNNAGGATLQFTRNVFNTYTFPNLSGTIALLEGSQTFTGVKSFDTGLLLKNGVNPTPPTGYVGLSSNGSGVSIITKSGATVYNNNLQFPLASNDYNFPNATGTIALTSDLSGYVTLATAQTISGAKTFSNNIKIDNGVDGNYLAFKQYATGTTATTGFTSLYAVSTNVFGIGFGTSKAIQFDSTSLTTTRTYILPDTSGTIALTSNLSAYLPLTGGTLTGFLSSTKSITSGDNGQITITPSTTTSAAFLQVTNADGTSYFGKNNNSGTFLSSSPNATLVYSTGSSPIMFYTNGNMIMTLGGGTPSVGGNVLINTTSDNGAKLQVSGTATFSSSVSATNYKAYLGGLTALRTYTKAAEVELVSYQSVSGYPYTKTTDLVANADSGAESQFRILTAEVAGNPTTRLFISSTGNVGIGTTSISGAAKLQVVGGLLAVEPTNGNTDIQILLGRGLSSLGTSAGSGITSKVNFAFEGSNDNFYQEIGFVTTTANQTRVNSAADFYISTKAAGASSPSEKFRITSGGFVYINTSSSIDSNNSVLQLAFDNNFYRGFGIKATAAGSFAAIYFYNNSGTVQGSITGNGSGLILYNTTSDYRLKQDFKDYNGLNLVSKIKTYDYEWKYDKSRMYGVIAHELLEIIPYAVYGKKDAINKNGEIEPQSVDYSKIVPILVKAIQEQTQIIKDLEARIVSLESK